MKSRIYICLVVCMSFLSGEIVAENNLLNNGDMENWTVGNVFPGDWGTNLYPVDSISNYVQVTTNAFSGNKALSVVYESDQNHRRFNAPVMDLSAGTYILKSHIRGAATVRWVRLVREGQISGDTPGAEAILPQENSRFPFKYGQRDWADQRLTFVVTPEKAGRYAATYSVHKTKAPYHFQLDDVSFYRLPDPKPDPWQSDLLTIDNDGKLVYHTDEYGFTLPDFSHAGYRGGGIPIPEVPVKKVISPIEGDNMAHIQAAINEVGAMPIDRNGIRGALLLKAGKYDISGSLTVYYNGVVLRGEGSGDDPATSTILYATGTTRRRLLNIGGSSNNDWGTGITSKKNITDNFVPVGARSFHVADASAYHAGDQIIIRHPDTQAWLDAVDGGVCETGAAPWTTADDMEIVFNRYVTHVDYANNEISIDAPFFYSLNKSLSQSYIHKFGGTAIAKEIGVENLRLDTYYDPSVTSTWSGEVYCSDEQHANEGLGTNNAENIWVRNVVARHFCDGVFNIRYTTRSTIENCRAIEPVSVIEGEKRYNFNMHYGTQLVLFKDCYASYGRHHYVSNGTTSVSGNVVKDCVSEYAYASTEGHRRWSTGLLFDNHQDRHAKVVMPIGLYNRGSYGTSHGWTTAHSVLWNLALSDPEPRGGRHIAIQKPSTAQNYAIGCFAATISDSAYHKGLFPGYIEGVNRPGLQPTSLYDAQLTERMNFTSDLHLQTIHVGDSVSVGGVEYYPPILAGFTPETPDYNMLLSSHYSTPPTLYGIPTDPEARAYTTSAPDITGNSEADRTSIIRVVGTNGQVLEYRVIFERSKDYFTGFLPSTGMDFAETSGIYNRDASSNHGSYWGNYGIRPHSSTECYLVTPVLKNGAGMLSLFVKRWNTASSSTLRILVKTATSDWVEKGNIPSSVLTSSWAKKTFDLNVEDPTVQVTLWIDREAGTSRATNFYFDDLLITAFADNTSIGDVEVKSSVKIYRNTSSVVIETGTETEIPYSICNIMGQIAASGNVSGKIEIPLIRQGLYIVKVLNRIVKITL